MARNYQKQPQMVNSNPFLARIERGEITGLDELKALYRTEAKRLHPDLQKDSAPGIDFDDLKQDYHEAYRSLLQKQDNAAPEAEPETAPPPGGFASLAAFIDEFRNLVARGFPINVQAAAKNRAYAASIRQISAYLNHHFDDPEFLIRANAETRALKRSDPTAHWYVLQIYWNIGDWRVTGYDYYRRIYVRHLAFIRDGLLEGGYVTLLRMLEFLVESTERHQG